MASATQTTNRSFAREEKSSERRVVGGWQENDPLLPAKHYRTVLPYYLSLLRRPAVPRGDAPRLSRRARADMDAAAAAAHAAAHAASDAMPRSQHAARMADGGFTIISSKRRGGRSRRAAPTREVSAAAGPSFRYSSGGGKGAASAKSDDTAAVMSSLCRRVDDAKAEVRKSALYLGLLQLLRSQPPIQHIVCLGVGNFASQYSARCQLALALLLHEELLLRAGGAAALVTGGIGAIAHLGAAGTAGTAGTVAEAAAAVDIGDTLSAGSQDDVAALASSSTLGAVSRELHGHEPQPLHVFDPVLEELELDYLRRISCAIRPRNEAGRIALPGRCLHLLPHCPRQLYSNLLEANWGPDAISQLIVLGNSFSALADALDPAERASTAGWCRVTRVISLVSEHACDALSAARGGKSGDFDHAFANTSLHVFGAVESMPPAANGLWTRPFDPSPVPTNESGIVMDA